MAIFSEFLNFFFYYFQSAFFLLLLLLLLCSANFSSQDLCGFEEEGRKYHRTRYYTYTILRFIPLYFFGANSKLQVYIMCKTAWGGYKKIEISNTNFFQLLLYTIFFLFGAAHRYWEFYAYASSPMCFVSLSTEVEYFLAYCR